MGAKLPGRSLSPRLPTPIQSLPRLGAALGLELHVKRDDLTGFAESGNKARKLEFLVHDALEQGADTLITVGALQSNCARATAVVSARLGLRCVLGPSGDRPGGARRQPLPRAALRCPRRVRATRGRRQPGGPLRGASPRRCDKRAAARRHPGVGLERAGRLRLRGGGRGDPGPDRGRPARPPGCHRGRRLERGHPGRPPPRQGALRAPGRDLGRAGPVRCRDDPGLGLGDRAELCGPHRRGRPRRARRHPPA